MSTAASIRFSGDGEVLWLRRGHDGHPGTVLPDLRRVCERCRLQWSGAEVACLVSVFLGETWKGGRLPDYEVFEGLHPDAQFGYVYRVDFVNFIEGWDVAEVDDIPPEWLGESPHWDPS